MLKGTKRILAADFNDRLILAAGKGADMTYYKPSSSLTVASGVVEAKNDCIVLLIRRPRVQPDRFADKRILRCLRRAFRSLSVKL